MRWAKRGLAGEVAHAAQIALPFFAHVGNQSEASLDVFESGSGSQSARDRQQGGQSGSVIGDAGTVQGSIRIDSDFVAVARGKHGIQVSGGRDDRAAAIGPGPGDHIAGAVDGGFAAERAELRGHPLGALLLEESLRGHAAQSQMLLLDPHLLADQNGEGFANAGRIGELAKRSGAEDTGPH